MAGPEKTEEDKFVRWCKKKNILCLKLLAAYLRGFPDRTVFLPNSVLLLLEFKAKHGRTSPHQDKYIEQLRGLGYHAEVVYSANEAIEIVEDLL